VHGRGKDVMVLPIAEVQTFGEGFEAANAGLWEGLVERGDKAVHPIGVEAHLVDQGAAGLLQDESRPPDVDQLGFG